MKKLLIFAFLFTMNPLVTELKKYGKLSIDAELAIHQKTIRQERNKGDFYLKEGQSASGLFMIEKGLVRAFFHLNNKEINAWFGTERVILGSIHPLFFQQPAKENIQFLEDSVIYSISWQQLNELYHRFPEFNTIGRLMAEEFCAILEKRIVSLHTLSASERYDELLKETPQLLQRISLGHIASYLGVTLETLSRIRGR